MKNVVITGAANGVGKAIANILKDNNLILIDTDEENLKRTAEQTNVKYYVCDVSNDKEIVNTIKQIGENYKTIDCLINCAGMWISGDLSKMEQPIYNEMNDLEKSYRYQCFRNNSND